MRRNFFEGGGQALQETYWNIYHFAAVDSRSQEPSVPKNDDNYVINM